MKKEEWSTRRYCPVCGDEVDVYWTRVVEKNAAGQTVVDMTFGKDAAGHEFAP
ncbi:hypothetical protein [Isoptericola sediminis]|uniref:Uncharacterized protein n=1 Tax=Isoptericola sediminis TaxID=2733572 RepID=A0A849K275_9MICO|nr:hypothetical protein [Isoptericola sediminis]NNU26169.1 hypothetical protein [Isoptericola sediminis]